MNDEIFVEKYRPKKFSEVVNCPEALPKLVNEQMPHLLMVGPPGGGKTSCAKIIIEKLGAESLVLNASSSRGIDTIRNKVKSFAQTASFNDKIKVILLEEGDFLTKESMTCLRNIFETYASNTRFIITGNYINKIIPALKSRCVKIEFKNPEKEDIIHRLDKICGYEDINVDIPSLKKLIDIYYPDMRRMINKLQELKTLNREITVDDISATDATIPELWKLLTAGDFMSARQLVMDSCIDHSELLVQLYNYMMQSNFSNLTKGAMILKIAECNKSLNNVVDNEIEFSALLLELIKVMN